MEDLETKDRERESKKSEMMKFGGPETNNSKRFQLVNHGHKDPPQPTEE